MWSLTFFVDCMNHTRNVPTNVKLRTVPKNEKLTNLSKNVKLSRAGSSTYIRLNFAVDASMCAKSALARFCTHA